jgi:hypothetical protein
MPKHHFNCHADVSAFHELAMTPYAAAMLARLINQVRLDGLRDVTPAVGLGWVVTEPARKTISVLDHNLQLLGRVPMDLTGSRTAIAAGGSFIAASDSNEIAVLEVTGKTCWRKALDRSAGASMGDAPSLHIDADGVLWIRAEQALLALDVKSGKEIHRVPLTGPDAALFLHRPTDSRTGLALLHPDPSPSMLISLVNDHIVLQPLVGLDTASFSPAGSQYLTMTMDGFLSVREVATEAVRVWRHLDDLPDLPPDLIGASFASWATFLNDDLVLASVGIPETSDDLQDHLLLSARSLRCRSRVRYPGIADPGSIVGSQQPDRWLTHEHEANTLRLWQLRDRLDDEPLPGQLHLL